GWAALTFANHSGVATAAGIKITSAGRNLAVMQPVSRNANQGEREADSKREPTDSRRHFDCDSPPAVGFAPSAGFVSVVVGSGLGLSESELRKSMTSARCWPFGRPAKDIAVPGM